MRPIRRMLAQTVTVPFTAGVEYFHLSTDVVTPRIFGPANIPLALVDADSDQNNIRASGSLLINARRRNRYFVFCIVVVLRRRGREILRQQG